MAHDPYAVKKYLVISDSLAVGNGVYQTRRTVTGRNLHEVLKKLVEFEHPRVDDTFSFRIERVPEVDE